MWLVYANTPSVRERQKAANKITPPQCEFALTLFTNCGHQVAGVCRSKRQKSPCATGGSGIINVRASTHTADRMFPIYSVMFIQICCGGRARFPFSGRQPGKINEICLWCTSFYSSALAAAGFYSKFQTRANWVLAKFHFLQKYVLFLYT
jgi:hypothetical protein